MKKLFFLISTVLFLTMVSVGFSASKSKIVYSCNGNIFTIDSDGSNLVQLTHTTEDENRKNFSPAWSADGSKIVFINGYFPRYDVWTMDKNGGNLVQLTNEGCNYNPRWSPKEDEIAFLSDGADENNSNISIINSDGYGQFKLTHSGYCLSADWSPDGTRIIFTYNDDLCIINLEDEEENIVSLKTKGYNPKWSPDGNRILFISPENLLCIINTDGQNVIKLTKSDNAGADWSPEGDKIVFSSGNNLFILNLIKKQIISLNKKGGNPSWSPNL